MGPMLLCKLSLAFANTKCCMYLQFVPVSTPSKRDVLQITVGIPPSIRSCWSSPLEDCLAVYMTFSQNEA